MWWVAKKLCDKAIYYYYAATNQILMQYYRLFPLRTPLLEYNFGDSRDSTPTELRLNSDEDVWRSNEEDGNYVW